MVIFITLYIVSLTSKASENKILWCYHLNETSSAIFCVVFIIWRYHTEQIHAFGHFFGELIKVLVHFSFETDFEMYRLLLC